MKKRRLLWTAGLLAILLAVPVVPFAIYTLIGKLWHEPFYHGLPASFWRRSVHSWCRWGGTAEPVPYVGDLLTYFGVGARPAVLGNDPDAVPVLLVLLQAPEQEVRKQAADVLANISPDVPLMRALFAILDDSRPRGSEEAFWVLTNYPPYRPRPVAIARTFVGSKGGPAGVAAVIPPPDLSPFIEALTDKDPRIRAWAASTLGERVWEEGQAGPEARQAMPALVAALRDQDKQVRVAAAKALKAIDPDAADRAGMK
jgi:hypothetical protein